MGFLRAAAAGLAGAVLLAAVSLASAQGYPSKSVRMIVPFPPGQATDIVARLLAEQLAKNWGQQVYVENRGGGGGIPGMLAGREAAADGYTITFGTSGTIGANPGLYAKLPYDPPKDYAMVGGVFVVPLMFVAHPGFPPVTVKDLVAAAKRDPGKISWAFAGTGTSQHLTGELFRIRAGIDMVGIPYKGSGPAMTDLIGGQVPLMVDSLASALPHVKGGKIKAIAMTTLQRVPQLPEVPTVAESGYPGFDGNGWAGLVVPAATPKDIVERIGGEVRRVMTDPGMQARVIERGAIPDPRGPAEWGEFVKAEIAKWGDIAKKANIRLD
jgi:tripartite-type tricarboxylate transporter receptor subunit TctC